MIAGYLSPLVSVLIFGTKPLCDGLSLDRLLQVLGFIAVTLGLLIVAFTYSRFNYSSSVTNFIKYRFRFFRYLEKNWRNLRLQIEWNKIITTRSAKKFLKLFEKADPEQKLSLINMILSNLKLNGKFFRS